MIGVLVFLLIWVNGIAAGIGGMCYYFKVIYPYYKEAGYVRDFRWAFKNTFPPLATLSVIPFVGYGIGAYMFILAQLIKKTDRPNITLSDYLYEQFFEDKK